MLDHSCIDDLFVASLAGGDGKLTAYRPCSTERPCLEILRALVCTSPESTVWSQVHLKMNKVNVALLFAALMIVGACAAPRKLLITGESKELADAEEHARILVELEEIHALRDRMLAEGNLQNPLFKLVTQPRSPVSA